MLIIIDNYDSFTYNLYQSVADKIPTRVFRNDEISIAEIEQLNPSAIILSPGPGHPKDAGICVELVKAVAHKIPILGICLGHQAIGLAFGCQVVPHKKIMHGKSSLVFYLEDNLFKSLSSPFIAGRYHSLVIQTNSIPVEICILGTSHHSTIMAIKHVHYPCYGVQFHPESILTPQGKIIFDNFITIAKSRESYVEHLDYQAYAA